MGLELRNIRDTDELMTRVVIKVGCQVRIESSYEVEFCLFDKLPKETKTDKVSCKLLCLFGQPSWPLKGSTPYIINACYFELLMYIALPS